MRSPLFALEFDWLQKLDCDRHSGLDPGWLDALGVAARTPCFGEASVKGNYQESLAQPGWSGGNAEGGWG